MQMHLKKECVAFSLCDEGGRIEAEASAFAEEAGVRLCYTLLKEDGATRTELGTPCVWMYSLRIFAVDCAGEATECLLRDVARTRERGVFLLDAARKALITPWAAAETVEVLLQMCE